MNSRRTTSVARRSTLVALLAALAGAACASSSASSSITEGPTPLNPEKASRYVFSYFKGNGEDGLHLAYSEDGYAWRALNDDKPYFHPSVGKEKRHRRPVGRQAERKSVSDPFAGRLVRVLRASQQSEEQLQAVVVDQSNDPARNTADAIGNDEDQ